MLRGQDIGSRCELVAECVSILQGGRVEALFGILPYVSLTRDPALVPHLTRLLDTGTRNQKLFAATALGSLRSPDTVPHLERALGREETFHGRDTHSLQCALVSALGETADTSALGPLLELYARHIWGDHFRLGRKQSILAALSALAQDGVLEAGESLLEICTDGEEPSLRADAYRELGTACWQQGCKVPRPWLEAFLDGTEDPCTVIQSACWDTLDDLAELGCREARDLFDATFVDPPFVEPPREKITYAEPVIPEPYVYPESLRELATVP